MERRDFLLHTINKSHWKGNTARQAVFALTMTRRGAGWKYIPKYAYVYSCTLKITTWIDDLVLMGCFSALCPALEVFRASLGWWEGTLPMAGAGTGWAPRSLPTQPTLLIL